MLFCDFISWCNLPILLICKQPIKLMNFSIFKYS
ncbi:hypothetical protein ACJIZ3_023237 [Penstemon smallii]|uniref:Uncharacterized protein n=1 Tax=Penstemon smallii TaxID=265156 RepID=A0ABD3TPT8_9LAMI